jgi:superfamily I DNA/RNA helicase
VILLTATAPGSYLPQDGSLERPFFERKADGSLRNETTGPVAWEQDEDFKESRTGAAKGKAERCFEVSFSNFLSHLWRPMRTSTCSTTKVSPSVVFQEIITSIKGASYIDGLGTAGSRGRPLSRDQYIGLPAKVGSFTCSNEGTDKLGSREQVYSLFEKYTTKCKQLGAYDSCDLGFHILAELRSGRHRPLPQLDWIYVDEVQDFILQQLELLLSVASNKNAMLLTGDTCQTISRGVSFRFSDLRQLFFAETQREGSEVNMPELLQLNVNYRTHQNVLDLANLVVGMITKCFPLSIDALEAERAHFSGPKPVLFGTSDPADLLDCLRAVAGELELGAEQLVIVRDAKAK